MSATLETQKFAENLTILLSHGPGVLQGLYNFNKALQPDSGAFQNLHPLFPGATNKFQLQNPEKPKILTAEATQPIIKHFVKKFPDVQDGLPKISGYDVFINNAKTYYDELQKFYQALALAVEFAENSLTVIHQLHQFSLSHETAPDLSVLYLELLVYWFSTLHFINRILPQEKRIIIAAYSVLHNIHHGHTEPRYSKICKFLNTYDKYLVSIQEQMQGLAAKVLGILPFMTRDIDTKVLATGDALKLSKIFVISPQISGGVSVESNDVALQSFHNLNRIMAYFVVCFVCFPVEFAAKPDCMVMLSKVLGAGYLIPLYGELNISVSEVMESAMKIQAKMSETKKLVRSAFQQSLQVAPFIHKNRRHFLAILLPQLLAYCEDPTSAFGNRLSVFLSVLSFARNEVTWYFTHYNKLLENESAAKDKKYAWEMDPFVLELIWGIMRLDNVLREYKEDIKWVTQHYLSELAAEYCQFFANAQNSAANAMTKCLFTEMENSLSAMSNKTITEEGLYALRMNWLRLQVCLSTPSFPQPFSESSLQMLNKISVFCERTKIIGETFDSYLTEIGSLRDLYYRFGLVYEHARLQLQNRPDDLRSIAFIGPLLGQFAAISPEYWAGEHNVVQKQCMDFAQWFYDSIAQYGVLCTREFLASTLALKTLKMIADKAQAIAKQKTSQKCKALIRGILRLLTTPLSVLIFDTEFVPMEFFTDQLVSYIQQRISTMVWNEGVVEKAKNEDIFADDVQLLEVKMPSVLMMELRTFFTSIVDLFEWGSVDVAAIIKDTIHAQVNVTLAKSFAKENAEALTIHRPPSPKTRARLTKRPPLPNQTYLTTYALWFIDFLTNKVSSGQVIWSNSEKCFVTRQGVPSQLGKYLSFSELVALCQLMGPDGVDLIDEKITNALSVLLLNLKDAVAQNMSLIDQIRATYSTDGFANTLKQFKQLKDLTSKMTSFGAILQVRKLLHKALSTSIETKASNLDGFVKLLHAQMGEDCGDRYAFKSTFSKFTNQFGNVEKVDIRLTNAVRSMYSNNLSVDQPLWSSLSFIFAALTIQACFEEGSVYNVRVDAFENNAHCLAAAFDALTCHGVIPVDSSASIGLAHGEFLLVTSTMWHHLQSKKEGTKYEMARPEAAWIILKHFINISKHLSAELVEEVLPYALTCTLVSKFFTERLNVITKSRRAAPVLEAESEGSSIALRDSTAAF